MIPQLYQVGFVVKFKEGDALLYRKPLNYQASDDDEYYTVKDGDTLLSIASAKYGYQYLWYIIADVNPNIVDIFELEVGSRLLIPNQETIHAQFGR